MARVSLVALALAALLALATALPEAIGVLTKTRHCTGACSGKIVFKEGAESMRTDVVLTLSGFPANTKLGVHVHQFGDLASVDGTAAGGHFNPFGTNHSCSGEDRHVGDLGNVETDADGNAVVTFANLTTMLDVDDESFILGRMVVVHERADDCTSQPSGDAGNRLAAGVIGYVNGTEDPVASGSAIVDDLTYAVAIVRGVGGSTVNAQVLISAGLSSLSVTAFVAGLEPETTYAMHLMNYGDLDAVDGSAFYNPLSAGTCASMAGRIGTFTSDEFGVAYTTFSPLYGFTIERSDNSALGRAIAIVNATDCFDGLYAIGTVGIRGSAAWPEPNLVARLRGVPSSNLDEDAYIDVTMNRVFLGTRASALIHVTVQSGRFPNNMNVSIHVREHGDVTNVDGTSFGNIFNPGNVAHGCNGQGEAGGLGNLYIDNGTSVRTFRFFSPLASVDSTDAGALQGRGIVVVDNLDTCAPGFTPGKPLLTGIIGYASGSVSAHGIEAPPNADATKVQATCILMPTSGNIARGTVQLVPQGAGVAFYVTLSDLIPNSLHGFHVHEFGDDRVTSGNNMGSHFNPLGYNHSCAPSKLRHAGDLGNVQADKNGRAYVKIYTDLLTLTQSGITSALGRGIILHSNPDDCQTQPTGNAGSRIAQCIIGLSTVRNVVAPTGEPSPTPTTPDDDGGAAAFAPASLTVLAAVAAGFIAARA